LDLWNNLIKNKTAKILLNILLNGLAKNLSFDNQSVNILRR